MKKTDRLIVLFCLGGMFISFAFSMSAVHKQNVRKENAIIEEKNKMRAEITNIMIWKKYHEDQMILMNKILIELQNKNNIIPVCNL